jgi:hypothetical protein
VASKRAQLRSSLLGAATTAMSIVIVLALAACGGDGSSDRAAASDYPLVLLAPFDRQPIFDSSGEVVSYEPRPPASEVVRPSRTCERHMATYHDGSKPTQRPILAPPRPGLRAVALSSHVVRLEWSFDQTPAECEPVNVRLSVVASRGTLATPTGVARAVTADKGTATIEYADFLPPPDTALASAYMANGMRSHVARVSISR